MLLTPRLRSLASLECLLLYLEKRSALRLAGLVLFLAAGLYTHNLALFYLPGLVVFWLVYPGERKLPDRFKDGLKSASPYSWCTCRGCQVCSSSYTDSGNLGTSGCRGPALQLTGELFGFVWFLSAIPGRNFFAPGSRGRTCLDFGLAYRSSSP